MRQARILAAGDTKQMSATERSTAPSSAASAQDGLLNRFMQRLATPLTTGLFVVSAVSGVALFFRWTPSAFHAMHEWLSMVLLAPFVFHVWKNWRSLLGYARRGTLVIPLLLSLVVTLPFAYSGMTGAGRGGNPMARAGSFMTRAPLTEIAPIFKTTPDQLLGTLRQRGFTVESVNQPLDAIAKASGKTAQETLVAVLPAR